MAASLGVAGVVIMDQHLEYGSESFLGFDLLQEFVERMFHSVLCKRSANCYRGDKQKYGECGPQGVLLKDMSRQETVEAIAMAYSRYKSAQCQGPREGTLLKSVMTHPRTKY